MKGKVRLACIASGSGTDFNSIATAWQAGWIPEVSEVVLISTKEGAGCLAKADALGIKHQRVQPKDKKISKTALQEALSELGEVDLIFSVGCVFLVPMLGIPTYNIHPADPHEHGGLTMYGLKVHEHVLQQILDQIQRGWKSYKDSFFTFPTVHEVSEEYDKGNFLLRASVEIPWFGIIDALVAGLITLPEAAEKLQKLVLNYEWQMLPCAVRMAAKKILAG